MVGYPQDVLQPTEVWDVAVIGAGPAGATAALVAASGEKRVIILERFRIPRYKTCGGGLIGVSMKMLPKEALPAIRAHAASFTFSLNGRFERTKTSNAPIINLVQRDDFDSLLVDAAKAAGAVVCDNTVVTRLIDEKDVVRITTRDQGDIWARIVVGADGSAGRSSAYVGVQCDQVDLGLEVEVTTPKDQSKDWVDRILIDWGRIPGAYGWVFPKGDTLSVGVIAERGHPDITRSYLSDFLSRLHLDHLQPIVSSGHLTRCRAENSPLYRGRVLVAGDAAGLLEPWTREGISFALRSGAIAGRAAVQAAEAASPDEVPSVMTAYAEEISLTLAPEMSAGRALLRAFIRHPRIFHMAIIFLPMTWRIFVRVISGETTFANITSRRIARAALMMLGSGGKDF